MNRLFLLSLLLLCPVIGRAQLDFQLHYDFGHDFYGKSLSNRPRVTATIEDFTADRWGSTYFFIDADFGDNIIHSAYGELSRELKFWSAPVAIHVEYNGGLQRAAYGYDDAYLLGAAWNWHNGDFSRTFSVQAMYKYLAHASNHGGTCHSFQLTEVWGVHFARGLMTFSGYCDLWYDRGVNDHLVLGSESQLWFNLWPLPRVSDDVRCSIGTEMEITNNLVWPADGINNRFYAIPTLAVKWTF